MYRLVLLQVVDAVGRAVAFQVVGGAAGDGLEGADAPRHQARILQFADPDDAIHRFPHQVHGPVPHADHQFHVRIAAAEVAQVGNEDQAADGRRHVDAQAPLGAPGGVAEGGLGLLHLRQDAGAMLVVGGPVRGQADAAGGAVEQAHLQQGLQVLDDGGDGGPGQAQGFRRPGEAVGVHHPGEDLHGLKAVHGADS